MKGIDGARRIALRLLKFVPIGDRNKVQEEATSGRFVLLFDLGGRFQVHTCHCGEKASKELVQVGDYRNASGIYCREVQYDA